jgi:catechol 2,3-dioxygenase-like lactoylglutathione lyase family enzyme
MAKPVCHHLHFYCRNLEDMIAYWSEVFGATVLCRRKFGNADGAELDLGMGALLFLKTVPEATAQDGIERSGVDHLGFLVDDLDAFLQKFVGRPHITLTREPFVAGVRRCAFISGPEGISVEVMQQIG